MVNPFDIPDEEKAARMAAKRTARLRAREGLFADFVEPVTAEQIQEAARRHRERFEATCRTLQARGEHFRTLLSSLVNSEELTALDERRAQLPDGPEYHADFWRRELERRR